MQDTKGKEKQIEKKWFSGTKEGDSWMFSLIYLIGQDLHVFITTHAPTIRTSSRVLDSEGSYRIMGMD